MTKADFWKGNGASSKKLVTQSHHYASFNEYKDVTASDREGQQPNIIFAVRITSRLAVGTVGIALNDLRESQQ